MSATLHIIGIGPGDPDLVTLKAFKILTACPVIVGPKSSPNGSSTALSIAKQIINAEEKKVHELLFPMKKIHIKSNVDRTVQDAWLYAANFIINILDQGNDVAFPTLGDPAIYSTGYYLLETIRNISPATPVQFIPGISAMSSCSATTSTPICLGDEKLAVIPATFSDDRIREILLTFDTVVLMKVHRVFKHLISMLNELNLLDKAFLVEKAGMVDERVIHELSMAVDPVHYFSTIIVRKNGRKPLQHPLMQPLPMTGSIESCFESLQQHKTDY